MSDSVRPHRQQPTRLPHPWDSPGKNTGVGCHFLLQCMKVKSESQVAQSCLTLSDPMDCSLPGSSIHGIFQARVLEWGAIYCSYYISYTISSSSYMCKGFDLLHMQSDLFLRTGIWVWFYLNFKKHCSYFLKQKLKEIILPSYEFQSLLIFLYHEYKERIEL